MTKIKLLLVGLVASLAVMALSATPAGAWFRSLNQKYQGPVEFSKTELAVGAAKTTCEKAEGEWHLQTKGQWWEHKEKGNPETDKQVKTLFGPHLYIKINKWNNCESNVTGIVVKGVTVSECVFQVEQAQKGATTGTGTVVSNCVITVPAKPECIITVTPGNHEGTNELLSEIKEATNSGKNITATIAIGGGIHGKASCLKPEEFTNGKFTSLAGGVTAGELELG